jgi:cellulose biosynthesis protein BcsQ
MAVIALASAAGSPGVTTTAVGLAFSWPRPVLLVEADPTGSSGFLAGFFRGIREYDGGLI